jgi:hypothetical protein
MSKHKAIVVFGKGRSGTNAYAEQLSQTTYQNHLYLKEFFGDDDSGAKLAELQQIHSKNPQILFNITPNAITDDILDFINTNCSIHLIIRRNVQDQFLSHVMSWFNNKFYANQVNLESNSIWINHEMFDRYRSYHVKYLEIRKRIRPEYRVCFENLKFITENYKSSYNLINRLDYIENKSDVIEFIKSIS